MKIIKSDSFIEWQEVLEDSLSLGVIKFHDKIGFLLNIAIPIMLLFVLKVDISTYFLCFIVFDILQVLFEQVILHFHKGINGLTWLIQKDGYKNKVDKLSLSEIENLKESLSSTNTFYNEKLNIINEKIEQFKSLESVGTHVLRKNELDFVQEMILKFKDYDRIDWIKDYMEKIVEVSNRLLELVKEDEEAISLVINTYNVYSEELLKIVIQYEDMDDEQQEKYQGKIIKLMDVFCAHLEEQEQKIVNFKERSIDFDIDFLTKKILNDGKEETKEDV